MHIRSDDDYYYSPGPGQLGSAHAVSADADAEDEAIRLLHEAVKEVTGKAVEAPVKPRIGFLP
jgi:hypothetical protein